MISAVVRREDARLLTGHGCYSDDVNLPGQAYASFVRSPHARARIRRIERHVAHDTGSRAGRPEVMFVMERLIDLAARAATASSASHVGVPGRAGSG